MERKWDSISPFYDTLPAMARKEDATLWNARTEGGNDSEFRQPKSGAHGTSIVCPEESLWPSAVCGHSAMSARDAASMGFFASFSARRFPKGERKALWCARRRSPIFPYEGLTRRRRRGSGTCRPMGLSHFSFDGERKVCKRKPAARHSRGGPPRCASRASSCGSPFGAVLVLGSLRSPAGKKPFIAHFDGGSRNVARNGVR